MVNPQSLCKLNMVHRVKVCMDQLVVKLRPLKNNDKLVFTKLSLILLTDFFKIMYICIYTYGHTSWERISRVSVGTWTYRVMIDNLASRSVSTSAHTWVDAFMIVASFVGRTLGTYRTLWSTRWRAADETWKTWAYCLIVYLSALTIRATWIWITRISIYNWKKGHISMCCGKTKTGNIKSKPLH